MGSIGLPLPLLGVNQSIVMLLLSLICCPASGTISHYLTRPPQASKERTSLHFLNEAHIQDHCNAGGNLSCLGCPPRNLNCSSKLHLVASHLLGSGTWMLRPFYGWIWTDVLPNLSSRSYTATAGYCGGKGILSKEGC